MDKEMPEAKYWGGAGKNGLPGDWPGSGGGGTGADLLIEIRFWTRIMKEHSMFIGAGLPCDRPEDVYKRQLYSCVAKHARQESNRIRIVARTPAQTNPLVCR